MLWGRDEELCSGLDQDRGKKNSITAFSECCTGAQLALILSHILALKITLSGVFILVISCIAPDLRLHRPTEPTHKLQGLSESGDHIPAFDDLVGGNFSNSNCILTSCPVS